MPNLSASPSGPNASAAPDDHATPTAVTIDDANRQLRLTWADGHETTLGYSYLRGLCPCAVCQGHGGDLVYVAPDAPEKLAIGDVLEVGHYALNMVWQDGHRTGIYALTYLRSLCPCVPCCDALGPAHAIHRVPKALQRAILSGATPPDRPA